MLYLLYFFELKYKNGVVVEFSVYFGQHGEQQLMLKQ